MDKFAHWTRWLRPSWHRRAAAAEHLAGVYIRNETAAEAAGLEYRPEDDPEAAAAVDAYVAAERVRAGLPADGAHERIDPA